MAENNKQQNNGCNGEFTYRPNVPINKKSVGDVFKPAEKSKEKEGSK